MNIVYYVIGTLLIVFIVFIIEKNWTFEWNILIKGIKKWDINMIKNALDEWLDINQKNESLKTPLMYACEKCNYEIVKYLIEKWADINAKDNVWQNALFYSLDCEDIEKWKKIVDLLIKKWIDINSKAEWWYTVLSTSPQYNIEFFEYLLEKWADVNIQNEEGNTMIMDEISFHNTYMVKTLLKYNPDLNIKNNNWKTAIDIAKEHNYQDILDLLNSYKNFN